MKHLLVLLIAVAALVFSLGVRADTDTGKDKEKPAKKRALLAHIKLSGLPEETAPNVDPLLGQIGEPFKAKIDRIKKARNDKDVQALLLEINGLHVAWGKLNELTKAVADFRAAGKKVYAHIESGSQLEYLLALSCDEVAAPESAWLMLTGLRAEATFYKGLLEKLGIKADMLQMGDYKGAAEPFTRDSLSEANRKQLTLVLHDYYDNEMVGRIVAGRASRKLSP